MAAQHSQFPRLKIKLGGKVFNEAGASSDGVMGLRKAHTIMVVCAPYQALCIPAAGETHVLSAYRKSTISGVHPAEPLFGVVQRTELRMPNHLVTSIRAPLQTPLTPRLVPEARRHMHVCHLYLTLQPHLSIRLSAGVAMLCKQSLTSATIAWCIAIVGAGLLNVLKR